MVELIFIWNDDSAPLSINVKLYDAIPLNALLWAGYNWSGITDDI